MHLVFYDGECGLCDRAVAFLLAHDKGKKFQFAPLQGKTAQSLLKEIPKELDSMVLLENGSKEFTEGDAALRTLWLLGSGWSCLGALYFILPSRLTNSLYRFVAKNRHRLFTKESCTLSQKDPTRFLP